MLYHMLLLLATSSCVVIGFPSELSGIYVLKGVVEQRFSGWGEMLRLPSDWLHTHNNEKIYVVHHLVISTLCIQTSATPCPPPLPPSCKESTLLSFSPIHVGSTNLWLLYIPHRPKSTQPAYTYLYSSNARASISQKPCTHSRAYPISSTITSHCSASAKMPMSSANV